MAEPEKQLREDLIAELHLSGDAIEKIYAVMQTTDMSFSEAAVQLGLVAPSAIALARFRADSSPASSEPGLIENAIRRISSGHQIVVRNAGDVTPGDDLFLLSQPYSLRSEKIRALRTELLLLNEGIRGASIVPILSPSPDEGRSQLCAELAVSFAQLGRLTLLVDADFRNPQQHALFGASNEIGLARSLSLNERPLYHPVIGLAQMHLITAGPVPPNPLELLSDGGFAKLLSEWRNNYEFIVIDTPPVSQFADGLAVATLAASVLIVSRAKSTSYKSTRDMLRRLESTQSTILGAVLNHF